MVERQASVKEKGFRSYMVLANCSQVIRSGGDDVGDADYAEAVDNSTVQLPAAAGIDMDHLPSRPRDSLVRIR